MFLVTAVKDKTNEPASVEIAGIFTTEDNAFEAKLKVQKWMSDNGFVHAEVQITPCEPDRLVWYNIGEYI